MKSLKWLGVGFVVLSGALAACANGTTVAEDEQDVTKPPVEDASTADTFRPSTRDGATTPPGDSSTPADAAKPDATTTPPDAAVVPDAAIIPDASGGLTDCDTSNGFLAVFAIAQIARGDFPACNASCGTCCWRQGVNFCLKP